MTELMIYPDKEDIQRTRNKRKFIRKEKQEASVNNAFTQEFMEHANSSMDTATRCPKKHTLHSTLGFTNRKMFELDTACSPGLTFH